MPEPEPIIEKAPSPVLIKPKPVEKVEAPKVVYVPPVEV